MASEMKVERTTIAGWLLGESQLRAIKILNFTTMHLAIIPSRRVQSLNQPNAFPTRSCDSGPSQVLKAAQEERSEVVGEGEGGDQDEVEDMKGDSSHKKREASPTRVPSKTHKKALVKSMTMAMTMSTSNYKSLSKQGRSLNDLSAKEIIIKVLPWPTPPLLLLPSLFQRAVQLHEAWPCNRQCWLSQV